MTTARSLRTHYALMLLFILTVALYYGSLLEIYLRPNVISIDDDRLMNDLLNYKLQLSDIFNTGASGKYYRPFLTLSFLLDQQLYGISSFGYRLTNVLFHAFNALLLYLIAKIGCKHIVHGERIAFLGSILFAVHPVAVESVSWISGRTDLLATFWSLLALVFYFSGRIGKKWYLIPVSLLCAFAAVLSKETGLAAPVIIAIWELFYFKRSPDEKKLIPIMLAGLFIVLLTVYAILRTITLSAGDMSIRLVIQGLLDNGILHTLELSLASVGFYLKKFIYPFPLSITINQINVTIYAFVGLIAISLFIYFVALQKNKNLSLFLLWTLFGFGPAAVVSLTDIAWTPWAERYLYFSLAPLSILTVMFAFGLAEHVKNPGMRAIYIIGWSIVVIFAASSVHRSFFWNDNLRMWEDTYKKTPYFIYAATGYAGALAEKGMTREAEGILHEAASLSGGKHTVYLYLGHISRQKGDERKARQYYSESLQEARGDTELVLMGPYLRKKILKSMAELELANAYRAESKERRNYYYHEAIKKLIEAYTEETSDTFLLYTIAKFYLIMGDNVNALKYLKEFTAKRNHDGYKDVANKMIEKIMKNTAKKTT